MSPGKKEAVGVRNQVIRKLILTKLNTIRKEKFQPKTIDKFSLVFRVFLLRYLGLNYEFTFEELVNELNKKKVDRQLKNKILGTLNSLTEIKYEGKEISKEQFKSLLDDAERIVDWATIGFVEEEKIEKGVEEKLPVKKSLLFNFAHKIGLVKTEEEKNAEKVRKVARLKAEKQREDERLRIEKEREKIRLEAERQREIERLKIEKEKERISLRTDKAREEGRLKTEKVTWEERLKAEKQREEERLRKEKERIRLKEIKKEESFQTKEERRLREMVLKCYSLIGQSRELLEKGYDSKAEKLYVKAKEIYFDDIGMQEGFMKFGKF